MKNFLKKLRKTMAILTTTTLSLGLIVSNLTNVKAEGANLNLALAKPVEASESSQPFTANAVVDGRKDRATGTFWATSNPNVWIIIDLEKKEDIGKVLFYFNKQNVGTKFECAPTHLKMSLSDDKNTWTTVSDKDTGIAPYDGQGISSTEYFGPYSIDFSKPVQGRYLKVEVTPAWQHIVEIEVYNPSTPDTNIVTDVVEPLPIVVTEGIKNNDLPLPHQFMFNIAEDEKSMMGRVDMYPSNTWTQISGDAFNGQVGEYRFKGTFKNAFIDNKTVIMPSNPNNVRPEINVLVKKARVISFIVPNQAGPTQIDEENQTINIKVLPGTDLAKIYPVITLSDYTESSIIAGNYIDCSKGSAEFNVNSTRNSNSYKWTVNVEKAKVQLSVYVATDGNDSNNGSEESPFKTVGKAIEYVKTINQNMTGNIIVYFRDGTYTLSDTINLTDLDSGTNGYNVVYMPYRGEKATFVGSEKVTGWQPVEGKPGVYKAPSPQNIDYSRELYVNGRRATVAKGSPITDATWYNGAGYPKTVNGYTVRQGYKTNGSSNYENMINWRNISDIEFGYKIEWTFHLIPIGNIIPDPDGRGIAIAMRNPAFELMQSGIGGYLSNMIGNPHFVQNAYELLDEPGESYFDRSEKYVYYKLRSGESIDTINAHLPRLENLIIGSGTEENPIHNITFNKISIEGSSYNRPNCDEGAVTGQASFLKGETWTKMYGAIKFDNAKNITFDKCDFMMIGKSALDFNKACQNNTIIGCKFDGIGSSAIQIGDEGTQESRNDISKASFGNNVISNKVYNVGETYNGGIGIWLGFGKDIIISHNDINHVSYSGISTGWSWGYDDPTIASNVIVDNNNVTNVLEKLNDGGGIYTLGIESGSRINGNYVHNNPSGAPGGIYLDEGSAGYTDISGNVIHSISNHQRDCFYLNRNVGYWAFQSDSANIESHMEAVMSNNFPANNFTNKYSSPSEKVNPQSPDMSLDYVRKTVENAGIHPAYIIGIPKTKDDLNDVIAEAQKFLSHEGDYTYETSVALRKSMYEGIAVVQGDKSITIEESINKIKTSIATLALLNTDMTTVDDAEISKIAYTGEWTPDVGKPSRYSNNGSAKLTFTGNKVAVYMVTQNNTGHVEVWIDGVLDKTITTFSTNTIVGAKVFEKELNTSGEHTVEIRAVNSEWIVFDKFEYGNIVSRKPIEIGIPELNLQSASFRVESQDSLALAVKLNNDELIAVADGVNLLKASEYSIGAGLITINNSYLTKLLVGTYNFNFIFSSGIKKSLHINVTNSSTIPSTFVTTFDVDGAKTTVITNEGATIVMPTSPTKSGYTFKGWFTSATEGTKVTTYLIAQTVYAQWIKDTTPIIPSTPSTDGATRNFPAVTEIVDNNGNIQLNIVAPQLLNTVTTAEKTTATTEIMIDTAITDKATAAKSVQIVTSLPTAEVKSAIANSLTKLIEIKFIVPNAVSANKNFFIKELKADKSIFEQAKASGKEIVVSVETADGKLIASWSFDGLKIANTAIDVNLAVNLVNASTLPAINTAGAGVATKPLVVSFNHSGNLPASAKVTLDVSAYYSNEEKLFLYYFNPETKKLELVSRDNEVAEGKVQIAILHCSDYVLTKTEISKAPTEKVNNATNPQTGDSTPISVSIVLAILGVSLLALRKKIID